MRFASAARVRSREALGSACEQTGPNPVDTQGKRTSFDGVRFSQGRVAPHPEKILKGSMQPLNWRKSLSKQEIA
jgi:hypothetical protein